MDESKNLNHTKWECKYHVAFIPKYRREALYKELRRHLGEVFRQLAKQKERGIAEFRLPETLRLVALKKITVTRWCGLMFKFRGFGMPAASWASRCGKYNAIILTFNLLLTK